MKNTFLMLLFMIIIFSSCTKEAYHKNIIEGDWLLYTVVGRGVNHEKVPLLDRLSDSLDAKGKYCIVELKFRKDVTDRNYEGEVELTERTGNYIHGQSKVTIYNYNILEDCSILRFYDKNDPTSYFDRNIYKLSFSTKGELIIDFDKGIVGESKGVYTK